MREIDPALAKDLADALGPWFVAHQRDLEWRRTRDPYAIWVSEIMLQQTRVDTVRAYYREFLRRFPDVGALAAADEEQVLEAWSGLGYYRRARLLHRGARYVAGELGGEVPASADGLRKIPGVGRYTAGAIASIAFDRPEPLVDGNVARVLSRILALTDVKAQAADAPGHWGWARAILEAGSPRVLAQALMELGATVCTPQGPRCDACPVAARCAGRAAGLQATIPAPKKRAAAPEHELWAVAIARRGRILVARRPPEGLLAGMWCLPLIPREAAAGGRPRPAAIKAATGVAVRTAKADAAAEPVRHVFSHKVWKLWPCTAAAIGDVEAPAGMMWIAAGERPPGGIPRVTEKVLGRLGF
ncbi:MAG: A/G-specific adenine glycosylase [Nannocystaceae bacterium]